MMPTESGPQPAATGAARNAGDAGQPTLFLSAPPARDGAARKLDALATLQARHAGRVLTARRAMLRLLLEHGTTTVESVRAALELPDGKPAHWLGCVPTELRRAGIIRRAGFTETTRVVAHARPISVWELADRAGALTWFQEHPDPPDRADRGSGGSEPTLFDRGSVPAVGAAGRCEFTRAG